MSAAWLRLAAAVGAGAVLRGLTGWFGQCSSGTCPLTSTWWRGALYGALLGTLVALSARPS